MIRAFQKKDFIPYVILPVFLFFSGTASIYFQGTSTAYFFPTFAGLLILGAFSFLPAIWKGVFLPEKKTVFMLFLYSVYVAITPFWSLVPFNSILFALIILTLPFVFFVIVLSPEPQRWDKASRITLVSGFVMCALWALYQLVFMFEEMGPRIHHPMLNPNNLAVLFNMALFTGLAFFFSARKPVWIVLAYVAVLLIFTGMLTTQSRGAFLSFLIAATLFFIFIRHHPGMTSLRLAAFVLGAVFGFFFVHHFSGGVLGVQFKELVDWGSYQQSRSLIDRKLLWTTTLDMALIHPWLGTGLGTFYYLYPRYRSSIDQSDGYFAHMDPLQYWQEMGILAPLLFYGVALAILLRTIRVILYTKPSSNERLLVLAPFCGLLALLGHTHITFHLYILVTMIPAGILLASWYLASERTFSEDRREVVLSKTSDKVGATIIMVFLFVAVFIWTAQAAAGIYLINQSYKVMATSTNAEDAYAYVKKSKTWAPDSYQRSYETEFRYYYFRLTSNPDMEESERKETMARAMEAIDKAIERNPIYANLYRFKAELLFWGYREGDIPDGDVQALALLEKAIESNPLLFEARQAMASIYKARGERRKALDILDEGLKWPMRKGPGIMNYYVETAQLKKSFGDEKGAAILMQKARLMAQKMMPPPQSAP